LKVVSNFKSESKAQMT